ncbi:MAG: hypothetical protein SNH79_03130 [Rikenellaceae bacterium]
MYTFSHTDYERIAEMVSEQIKSTSLTQLNITLENDEESADITLKALVVPIVESEKLHHRTIKSLHGITPVWWEVTTTTLDGEVINDFDIKTLNEYLEQW